MRTVTAKNTLSAAEYQLLDAWWRAANYLSVGQIYLQTEPAVARAAASSSTSSRGCSATGARRRA